MPEKVEKGNLSHTAVESVNRAATMGNSMQGP